MKGLNQFMSEDFISRAISNPLLDQTCAQLHAGSCNLKALSQFGQGCQSVYKMYLLVHLIPLIIKRKQLREDPAGQLKKLLIGFIKSLIFAGGYCALVRRCVCLGTTYYKYSSVLTFPIGVLASITLVLQQISRQSEIALYTLNKSTEVLYNIALRRNMVPKVPLGECWLTSIAFAIICFVYLNEPQTWRANYRRVLDKIIGDI